MIGDQTVTEINTPDGPPVLHGSSIGRTVAEVLEATSGAMLVLGAGVDQGSGICAGAADNDVSTKLNKPPPALLADPEALLVVAGLISDGVSNVS